MQASSALSSASHHLRDIRHIHSNPITGAASDVLSCDIHGVSKYDPLSRSRVGRDESNRNRVPEYRSRVDVSLTGSDGANADTFLRTEIWNSKGIATLPKSVQLVVRRIIDNRLLIPSP
jgi:dynactin-4